jgi:hypothetical protein
VKIRNLNGETWWLTGEESADETKEFNRNYKAKSEQKRTRERVATGENTKRMRQRWEDSESRSDLLYNQRTRRSSGRNRKPFASIDSEGAIIHHDGCLRDGLCNCPRRLFNIRAGKNLLIESGPEDSQPCSGNNCGFSFAHRHLTEIEDAVCPDREPFSGLLWYEIFDWLCNLPVGNIYCGFAFNYDANMFFSGFLTFSEVNGKMVPDSEERVRQMQNLVISAKHYAFIGDAEYGVWKVEYLRHAFFSVTPMKAETLDECKTDNFISVCDQLEVFDWDRGKKSKRKTDFPYTSRDTGETVYLGPMGRFNCGDHFHLEHPYRRLTDVGVKNLLKSQRNKIFYKCPSCEYYHLANARNGIPTHHKDESHGHSTRISDSFRLYGRSFLKAASASGVATREELLIIDQGKKGRIDFACIDLAERMEVLRYNAMEIELHQRMMEELRSNCAAVGIYPERWESPGYIARALLWKHKISKTKEYAQNIPDEVWMAGFKAFHAGWFDAPMVGPIPGTRGPRQRVTDSKSNVPIHFRNTGSIIHNDINSAYPWALTQLPDFANGTWERRLPREGEKYCLQKIHFRYPHYDYNRDPEEPMGGFTTRFHPFFMGFPLRTADGHSIRPVEGIGWYWTVEIEQGDITQNGHQEVEILTTESGELESLVFIPDDPSSRPYAWLADVYKERKSLDAINKNKGVPLKLGPNSIYGQKCQKVGGHPYQNYVEASLCTAMVRAHLHKTIHENTCQKGYQCGSTVAQVATDCIDWIQDPSLPVSDELGGWSRDEFKAGMWSIQPGIYWPRDRENLEADWRTRGINPNILLQHAEDIKAGYRRMITHVDDNGYKSIENGNIDVYWVDKKTNRRAQQFIGMHVAYLRSDWSQWLQWVPLKRTIGFDFLNKRNYYQYKDFNDPDEPIWTVPRMAVDLESTDLPVNPPEWHGLVIGKGSNATRQGIEDRLNDTPSEYGVLEGMSDDYWTDIS